MQVEEQSDTSTDTSRGKLSPKPQNTTSDPSDIAVLSRLLQERLRFELSRSDVGMSTILQPIAPTVPDVEEGASDTSSPFRSIDQDCTFLEADPSPHPDLPERERGRTIPKASSSIIPLDQEPPLSTGDLSDHCDKQIPSPTSLSDPNITSYPITSDPTDRTSAKIDLNACHVIAHTEQDDHLITMPTDRFPESKVPDLSSCGHFDGTESAARWIAQLHWQFKRVGYTEKGIPPSEAISSINMLCTKGAATFLDSTPKLQDIIDRSTEERATSQDLADLEQALKDRYPVKPIDPSVSDAEDLTRIAQDEDEPLAQYYSRIQNALRQAGGRDIPKRDPQSTSLSPAETTLLKTVVCRFVDGLHDFKLRQEALGHRARASLSLWQCYEIIQESSRILDDKRKADDEEKNRVEIDAIRKALKEFEGLSIEEAVARYHPQMSQPLQIPQIAAQSASVTQQSASAPASQSRQDHPRVTCFACNQRGHYANNCPNPKQPQASRGSNSYSSGFPSSASLPPRGTSKNPLVNGTETLADGEKACFRCGDRSHLQTKCTAPQASWLAWWEQAHLKAIMFPATRYRNSNLPAAEVQSRSAQLFYEMFLDDEEAENARCERQEAEVVIASNSAQLTDESLEHSVTLDENMKLSEELQTQVLILQSLLTTAAGGHTAKRRRDGDTAIPISSLLDDPPAGDGKRDGKRKQRKGKDPNKPPKPMAEIRGRKGEGPYDYKAMLQKTVLSVSLMDLLQLSPDFTRNLKHLSIRASEKAKRMGRRYAKMKDSPFVQTASSSIIQPTKAYQITPVIKYAKNGKPAEHTVRQNSCQADQGSDVNIIHPHLVDHLGLPRLKVRDLGVDRLYILNSAGRADPVDEFVVFVATVERISRPVWALVQPEGGKLTTLVILGLPWLWDVKATFDIRNTLLTIGDSAAGDVPIQIQGPLLSFTGNVKGRANTSDR
ncbi:hypothetical protein GGR50DRAFT_699536 [Xylaria sp. CBS 124048]|nr:hypothetical protein GGR50DRAFT_699536 [Xylaria sp. CBS 124048]